MATKTGSILLIGRTLVAGRWGASRHVIPRNPRNREPRSAAPLLAPQRLIEPPREHGERLVGLLELELLRIERTANPTLHLGVLCVVWVAEHPNEVLVARRAAAVLGGLGTRAT